jgi:hypothetical protein
MNSVDEMNAVCKRLKPRLGHCQGLLIAIDTDQLNVRESPQNSLSMTSHTEGAINQWPRRGLSLLQTAFISSTLFMTNFLRCLTISAWTMSTPYCLTLGCPLSKFTDQLNVRESPQNSLSMTSHTEGAINMDTSTTLELGSRVIDTGRRRCWHIMPGKGCSWRPMPLVAMLSISPSCVPVSSTFLLSFSRVRSG